MKIPSNIQSKSILIGILHLIKLILLCDDVDKDSNKRGRPYVYPTAVILRCFIVRIWFRIPSNNALHYFLSLNTTYHKKIIQSCGLHSIPDRRTFDRRFKVLPIRDIISIVGRKFVTEEFSDCRIVAVDSSLIYAANRRIWHKKHMMQNIMPRPGIDTDARWGFTRTKGWVFGYKIHMCCSTGLLPVPLSTTVYPANVDDTQAYCGLVESIHDVKYVVADMGYDDHKLYDFTRQKGARLICPIRRYRYTEGERLKLIRFYKSRHGRRIYHRRGVSVEPLFQCIKDAFGISVMPVYGFENVRSYVLMCVLVYQMSVYYNVVRGKDNPKCVKHMLGN